MSDEVDPQEKMWRMTAATDLVVATAPPDDRLGEFLAMQMIATHAMALDSLCRARSPGVSFAVRDLNLKHGIKLLGQYTRQVDTFDRHRAVADERDARAARLDNAAGGKS